MPTESRLFAASISQQPYTLTLLDRPFVHRTGTIIRQAAKRLNAGLLRAATRPKNRASDPLFARAGEKTHDSPNFLESQLPAHRGFRLARDPNGPSTLTRALYQRVQQSASSTRLRLHTR